MLVYFFIIGSILGSFAAALFSRNSNGESILSARSHCDYCKKIILFRDLIPIFSYLFLIGKCRYCKRNIGPFTFICELGFALIWLTSYSLFHSVILNIILSIMIYLSIEDISNKSVHFPYILCLFIFSLIYNFNPLMDFIYILFYLLISLINHHKEMLGSGDIDFILILMIINNVIDTLKIVLIGSCVCLICLVLTNKLRARVPFIPFLLLGYLIIICIKK